MRKLIHPAGDAAAPLGLVQILPLFRPLYLLHRRWPAWLPRIVAPLLTLIVGHIAADTGVYPPLLFFSLLLFGFFAFFLQRWAALFATIGLESLLNVVTAIKEGMTDEPLVARDLLAAGQGAALTSYLDAEVVGWLVVTVLAIGIGLWRQPPWNRRRLGLLPFALILPLMLLVRVYAPHEINRYQNAFLEDQLGAHYLSYNFHENIRSNGILGHVFFTAESVEVPERGPHDFYAVAPMQSSEPTVAPDVVMILCEACFTSQDGRFSTPIAQLTQRGFSLASVVSPVFGGGTAEAESEFLIGLPSSVLPGIDYQNFASAYRDKADTLAALFKRAGYQTFGIHNFHANFWKREDTYPKFGFNEMHFIDEMQWEEKGWPADRLLYDKALSLYGKQPKRSRTFMFLVTVHTHGAYAEKEGDGGRGDYEKRLAEAVADLNRFVPKLEAKAKARGRKLMFMLVGDHKPSLSKAFVDAGVFDQSYFRATGARNGDFRFALNLTPQQRAVRGEVPLFVRYAAEPMRAKAMGQTLAGRPMFCVPAVIAQQLPYRDRYFDTLAARCERDPAQLADEAASGWQREFPRALFAERLF